MTVCRNKPIGGIIGEGIHSVAEHIAVGIKGGILTVEDRKTVVRIVLKAAVGSIGEVACGIVGEGLLRENNVTEILDCALDDSTKVIISIAQLSGICKDFFLDDPRQVVVGILISRNHSTARRSLDGRGDALHIVVDRGRHASVGLGDRGDALYCKNKKLPMLHFAAWGDKRITYNS